MENEFQNIDDLFRESFSDYSEAPPPAVWPALEKRLDKDKKRRVFPLLRWYWLGALLAFVSLLGATITANMKLSAPVTGRIANTSITGADRKVAEMSPAHEKAVPQTVEKMSHSDAAATKRAGTEVEIHTKRHHKNDSKNRKQQTSKSITQDIKRDRGAASADEVSVYGNAPTVGTSVYSYDDFEQEPDASKGQMDELRDAQNSPNAGSKHKIVVVESYNPAGDANQKPERESTESLVGDPVDRAIDAVPEQKEGAPANQAGIASRSERMVRAGKMDKKTGPNMGESRSSKIASAKSNETQKALVSRKVKTKTVANNIYIASKGAVSNQHATNAVSKPIKHDGNTKRLAKNDNRSVKDRGALAIAENPSKVQAVSEKGKTKTTLTRRNNRTDSKHSITVAETVNRTIPAAAIPEDVDKVRKNANPRVAHKGMSKQMATGVAVHKLPGLGSEPGVRAAATSKTQSAKGKPVQKQQMQKLETEVGKVDVTAKPDENAARSSVAVARKSSTTNPEAGSVQRKPTTEKSELETTMPASANQEVLASAKAAATVAAKTPNLANGSEKKTPVNRPVVDRNAKVPPVMAAVVPAKVASSVAEKEVEAATKHGPDAEPVSLPAKKAVDTVAEAAAIADPKEECPDSTAKGITPFMRFVFGIKGGLESGFSINAGNKVLVAPYIRYNLSEKVGIQLQPALKVGRLSTRTIGPAAYYHDIHAGTGQYELTGTSLVYLVFSGDTLVRRDYTYTEKYDSIIKQNQVGGTYAEIELPVLLQYQVGKRLSVYGGLNTVLGKRFSIEEKTKTYRDVTATGQGFSLTRLNEPAILPPTNGVVYSSSPISSYGGAQYPVNGGSILRMGYMLGVSYELKRRWSVDAAVQQCFLQKNIQAGYNVNQALSAPYFRITVGYRLSK
ncbi:MAG: hypothetical protein KF744_00055 [Taibaiella sp.]|nr:hypothetical protein [Taibaiella sp.]